MKVEQQAASAAAHAARGTYGVFGASRAMHLRKQLQRGRAAAASAGGASSSVAASRNDEIEAVGVPAESSADGGLANLLARSDGRAAANGSTEAVAPPRDAAPSTGSRGPELQLPDYFERQQAGYARCGLHALNNALGAQLITAEDMSTACTAYLAEMQFEGKLVHVRVHGCVVARVPRVCLCMCVMVHTR